MGYNMPEPKSGIHDLLQVYNLADPSAASSCTPHAKTGMTPLAKPQCSIKTSII